MNLVFVHLGQGQAQPDSVILVIKWYLKWRWIALIEKRKYQREFYTLNVKLMGIVMNDFQTSLDKQCVVFDSVSQNQDAWELN